MPLLQLRSRLPGFLAGAKAVLCDFVTARSPVLLAALQAANLHDAQIRPLSPLMHRLRLDDALGVSYTCICILHLF
jgi:hypothetical protein